MHFTRSPRNTQNNTTLQPDILNVNTYKKVVKSSVVDSRLFNLPCIYNQMTTSFCDTLSSLGAAYTRMERHFLKTTISLSRDCKRHGTSGMVCSNLPHSTLPVTDICCLGS